MKPPPLLAAAAAALVLCTGPAAPRKAPPPPAPRTPTVEAAVPAATAEVCAVFDDLRAVADAKFSKSRAESVSRLLARGGLEAPVFPLSALRAALAEPCRVAHLVLLDAVSSADRAALDAFAARGGRVVVHGATAPELAAFFGVSRPDPARDYRFPPGGGSWEEFRFSGTPPLNAPARIANRAAKVLAATPVSPGVTVAARWRDARGAAGPPAILRGPKGWWLVRPLYEDGSGRDRARLLSALTCNLRPPLWRGSSKALEARAWAAVGAASRADAERALLRLAPKGRAEVVRASLRRVAALDDARAELFRKGLYGAAQSNLWALVSEVRLARAATMPVGPVRKGRPLAVWAPTGFPPAACRDWDDAAAKLAAAGATDLYLYAGSLAAAVADLPGVPKTPEAARRGNPFPAAVAACRRLGIRVHAWMPALQFEHPPEDRFAAYAKAGRLLRRDPGGEPMEWLAPASPAVAAELSRAVCAVAREEGVDGIHLDFLRYPSGSLRGSRDPATVTALLARLRADLRAAAPACALSVAVYGGYPACVKNRGQDWQAWLDRGLCDRCVPMNYVPDLAGLRRLAGMQRRNRSRLLCGIGASSKESLLEPDGLVEQLREAYALGYAGAAIYAFDDRFVEELVPALRLAR